MHAHVLTESRKTGRDHSLNSCILLRINSLDQASIAQPQLSELLQRSQTNILTSLENLISWSEVQVTGSECICALVPDYSFFLYATKLQRLHVLLHQNIDKAIHACALIFIASIKLQRYTVFFCYCIRILIKWASYTHAQHCLNSAPFLFACLPST